MGKGTVSLFKARVVVTRPADDKKNLAVGKRDGLNGSVIGRGGIRASVTAGNESRATNGFSGRNSAESLSWKTHQNRMGERNSRPPISRPLILGIAAVLVLAVAFFLYPSEKDNKIHKRKL